MNRKDLSYRSVERNDLESISQFPQNEEELFFMFPQAEYSLPESQLEAAINSRFDSTVILLNDIIVGYDNFYEVIENHHCSIGNVIVSPNCRNQGIGKFIIHTMEQIAIKKYKVSELRLSCFSTNTKEILLYTQLEYIPYEIEQRTN